MTDSVLCHAVDGPCKRTFHVECLGMSETDLPPAEQQWLCDECSVGRHTCFVCKEVGQDRVEVLPSELL